MDVGHFLNYTEENNTSADILTYDQIIESVVGTDKDDELKYHSVFTEPHFRKEAIKAAMILNFFFEL